MIARAQKGEVSADALRVFRLIASGQKDVLLVLKSIQAPLHVVGGVDEDDFGAGIVLVPEVLHRVRKVLLVQLFGQQNFFPELEVVGPAIVDSDKSYLRRRFSDLRNGNLIFQV